MNFDHITNAVMRPAAPRIGFLESLPKWLICVPLVAQWLALSVRHRSITLPSAANPYLTAGGLVGERKTEYFESMGPIARAACARSTSFTLPTHQPLAAAQRALRDAGLELPVVAKPELGWCGFGVRRIASLDALAQYLAGFPAGEAMVFQEYLSFEGEAGVFYVRHPDQAHGKIIGIALRHFARVIGDGRSTVARLIESDPRARRLALDKLHKIDLALDEIPTAGKVVRLATIGSLRAGALYTEGSHLITPELDSAFDAIARDMHGFHFGRFDVRYVSEDDLRGGGGFRIIEVNGAGSEAIHAWDPRTPPHRAFAVLFAKQALLFEIAAANRRLGHQPIGMRRLAQLHLHQQRLIDRYPPSN